MIRAALIIALSVMLCGCLQNKIFGKCSPYSAPNTNCVK